MFNPISGLNPLESDPQISLNIIELLEMGQPFSVNNYVPFFFPVHLMSTSTTWSESLSRNAAPIEFSFIMPVIIKE